MIPDIIRLASLICLTRKSATSAREMNPECHSRASTSTRYAPRIAARWSGPSGEREARVRVQQAAKWPRHIHRWAVCTPGLSRLWPLTGHPSLDVMYGSQKAKDESSAVGR
jgi:hypothetical protein